MVVLSAENVNKQILELWCSGLRTILRNVVISAENVNSATLQKHRVGWQDAAWFRNTMLSGTIMA